MKKSRIHHRRSRRSLERLEERWMFASDSTGDWFQVIRDEVTDRSWESALIGTAGNSFRETVSPSELGVARWIVRLTDDATHEAGTPAGAERILGLPVQRGLGSPGLLLVETICQPPEEVRAAFASHPAVRGFELESFVRAEQTPDDPLYRDQRNLSSTGQSGGLLDADIDAPEAWGLATSASTIVIGVIDSGVDYTHPDLYRSIWLNADEIPLVLRGVLVDDDGDGDITIGDLNRPANAGFVSDSNRNGFIDAADILVDPRWVDGSDTDANGFIDDFFGWDFAENDNSPFDEHRHGTHVTGILGATGNNGIGISGVSWQSSVMPLRFLDATNEGSTAHAIAAFNYATLMRHRQAANVRILNASWGGGSFSEALYETVELAGDANILTVAAAGNGDILGRGVDLESQPFYPASFDLANVISVAASDTRDELARFSNYGRRAVDIAAPGVGIWSTEPGNAYQERNGTSMAAPHVSGAAALVWSQSPDASPAQVKQAILSSADALPQLKNLVASGGRLNVHNALLFDPVAPTAALESVLDVQESGGGSYSLTVTYSDDRGIAAESLDDADILVSRSGGNAFSVSARLVSVDLPGDGTQRVATYAFIPPDDTWDYTDNGTYRITLRPSQVRDTGNNVVGGRLLGTFHVTIPPPVDTSSDLVVSSLFDSVDLLPGDGKVLDSQGNATLRAAIQEANAREGADRIRLPTGTIQLSLAGANEDAAATGDLDVTSNLELVGAGRDQTILDAGGLDRIIQILDGATVTLRDLTIRGGDVSGEGGGVLNAGSLRLVNVAVVANRSTSGAGGIHSTGPLSLEQSTIEGNRGAEVGGLFAASALSVASSTIGGNEALGSTPPAIATAGGLWIGATATASIHGVTIAANRTATGVGGMRVDGEASVVNSTISGNVGGEVGGIESGSAPLSLDHVTITDNTGDAVGGASGSAARVGNSIIAANVARTGSSVDVGPGPFTTLGHNLIGIEDGTASFVANENGDLVGSSASPLDPRLTPLADWGGPTWTHALLADSIAIDSAEQGTLTEDQRGAERTLDGGGLPDLVPDIGAFEFGTFFVDDTTDSVDAALGDGLAVDADGRHTLRAAIQEANTTSARNVIVVGPGHYTLTLAGIFENQAAAGDLDLAGSLTIVGAGRDATIIDAAGLDRVFDVQNADVEISDLRLTGGFDSGGGGGVYVQGRLQLKRVDVTNNTSLYGGAIYAQGADSLVRIEASTIANNVGSYGGGIFSSNTPFVIVDSHIEANQGIFGGGIRFDGSDPGAGSSILRTRIADNAASSGAGILFALTRQGLTVTESTIESNTASDSAGGVYAAGGAEAIRLQATLIAGNTAKTGGGGLYVAGGVVDFTNATISGNRATQGPGGGMLLNFGSVTSLVDTTVTNNVASVAGGVSVGNNASVTTLNTLIAGNFATFADQSAGDVRVESARFESRGATLIGRAPDGALLASDSDLIGTSAHPIDPLLGPLQDNGGPTLTHALRSGSPAIDAGVADGLVVDARGVMRPQDGDNDTTRRPDLGAVEFEYGQPIRVEGVSFDDRNGNGKRDAQEQPLSKWTVFVDLDRDGHLDSGEPSTLTDDNGRFEFTGIDSGNVLISQVPRSGWERIEPGVGRVSFVSFGDVDVGDSPQVLASADLDGDGELDLVTADFGSDQVSIARGLGGGRFAAAVTVAVGKGPVDVVAADLDRDGDLDLATANFTGDSVTWLRNDGPGLTFTSRTLAVGDGPRAIVAVDLDDDGRPELISADSLSNQLTVWQSNASGEFSVRSTVFAGESPQDMVVADFDRDGDQDLAVTNLEAFTVSVLMNDDFGSLELFGEFGVGAFPRALAAGDLDGDGAVDLAVASSFSNDVAILMNNGQGGFNRRNADLVVGTNPRGVALADLDHDQRLDLITVNAADDTVTVRRGLGRSNPFQVGSVEFGLGETFSVGRGPRGLAVTDFDRDGNLDLATVNQDGRDISIARNAYGSYALSLLAGDVVRQLEFGNRLRTGSLRGTVFHDLDADGTRDDRDLGLSGWLVFLDDNDDGVWNTGEPSTQTDANGEYRFDALEPGRTYVVRHEVRGGWEETSPRPQEGNSLSTSHRIELGIGEQADGLDFGNRGAVAQIRGVKFQDLDLDGERDADEPPLAGWTIYVDLNANGQLDGDEPSTITNANGEYTLGDLPPATDLIIDEVPRAGWNKTSPIKRVEFGESLGLSFPGSPDLFAFGDLEGDGDQDLVVLVSDGSSQQLLGLANNGQGRFIRKWSYLVSPTNDFSVTHLELGDIDRDGLLDVVVNQFAQINIGEHRVVVLKNQDNTRLVPIATRVAAAARFSELVVRDLNGDGAADIIYGPTTGTSTSMQLMINDGEGQFPAELEALLTLPRNATWQHSLLPGDMDGDGDIDLVTGVYGTNGDALAVYFNHGDGTFLPLALSNVSLQNISLRPEAVGDIDDDGDLDFVAVKGSSPSRWELFRNQGDGTFVKETVNGGENREEFEQLFDLDSDGDLDLVFTSLASGQPVVKYLDNDGKGRFVSSRNVGGTQPRSFRHIADFNRDGRPDLMGLVENGGVPVILLSSHTRAAYFVRLDVGESRVGLDFGAVEERALGGVGTGGTSGLVFQDTDGDGRRGPNEAALAGITIFVDEDRDGTLDANEMSRQTRRDNPDTPNDETGTYSFDDLPPGLYTIVGVPPPGFELTSPRAIDLRDQTFTTGDSPQAIATADFDGDGDLDLATANSETNNVSILFNQGDATFGGEVTLAVGFGPVGIAAGDVDGDGRPDMLVANRFGQSVSLLRQRPDRSWDAAVTIAVAGAPSALTWIDADSDGDLDAAVSLERLNQVQLLTNVAGTFSPSAAVNVGRSPNGLSATDLDGDGDRDLLVANFDGGNVSVLKNRGDGVFSLAATVGTGRGAFAVTAADVDADGDRDVLVANFLANTVSLLRNRSGVLQAAETFPAGSGPAAIVANDLDRDGDLDLAVGNATTTNMSVLLNSGDGTFGAPANFGVANFPKSLAFSLAAADFNGDGMDDLALASSLSNQVAILRAEIEPGPYRFTLSARQEVTSALFGMREVVNEHPPIANTDTSSVDEDTLLTFAAPGLLLNDTDEDVGDVPKVTRFDALSRLGAVVTVHANGGWSYDPTQVAAIQSLSRGETLEDRFTYTITDRSGTTSSTSVTLTVRGVSDWMNPQDPDDVNHDGFVTSIDALIVINELNDHGSHSLPGLSGPPTRYYDTNGDNFLAPLDALKVINRVNAAFAEGESFDWRSGLAWPAADWIDLLADDQLFVEPSSSSTP